MGSFIGGSGEHKPRKVNVHRTINMITDITEAREPRKYLRSVPGLSTFSGAPIPAGATCNSDSLVNFIADYTLVSGTTLPFTGVSTNYGPGVCLKKTSSADNASAIQKIFTPFVLDSFSTKFKILNASSDDTGNIGVISSESFYLFFNPRREPFYDPQARAEIVLDGTQSWISTSALPTNQWMQLDLDIVDEIATVVIRTLPDAAILYTTVMPGTYTATSVDATRFYIDNGTNLSDIIYTDVHICTNS